MKINCPYCRKEMNFMDVQMSKDLNYVFNALTVHDAIKRHGSAVMGYVCLFGVTPFHLKAPKFRRIMEEMVKLFDAQSFSFQKKTYDISHAGIVEALDVCIKKNFNEILENHNYLKRVMITIADREEKTASIASEKALRQKEKALAGGGHREGTPTLTLPPRGGGMGEGEEVPARISPDQAQKNIARIGEIIKSIAK